MCTFVLYIISRYHPCLGTQRVRNTRLISYITRQNICRSSKKAKRSIRMLKTCEMLHPDLFCTRLSDADWPNEDETLRIFRLVIRNLRGWYPQALGVDRRGAKNVACTCTIYPSTLYSSLTSSLHANHCYKTNPKRPIQDLAIRQHTLATSQSLEIEKGQLSGMANVKRACEGSFPSHCHILGCCFFPVPWLSTIALGLPWSHVNVGIRVC